MRRLRIGFLSLSTCALLACDAGSRGTDAASDGPQRTGDALSADGASTPTPDATPSVGDDAAASFDATDGDGPVTTNPTGDAASGGDDGSTRPPSDAAGDGFFTDVPEYDGPAYDAPRDPVDAGPPRTLWELHVSPTGTGTACTEAAPCALDTARQQLADRRAPLGADAHVYLHDGTYVLARPLVLTPADSGDGGHEVIYEPARGARPVLSGAEPVTTPWTVYDRTRGIYRTPLTTYSRHLTVNGERAIRARGPRRPAGYTSVANGFTAPDASMSRFRNRTEIELVGYWEWTMYRCTLASIDVEVTGTGDDPPRTLLRAEPECWNKSYPSGVLGTPDSRFQTIEWIENALELLDEEGEFYNDRFEGALYYKPPTGFDPARLAVTVPRASELVLVNGDLRSPVHDVRFRGLTFADTTWDFVREPGHPVREGYSGIQAGLLKRGPGVEGNAPLQMPGVVRVRYAQGVTFERDTFVRLGSAALELGLGTQRSRVEGCRFEDIDGAAVTVGGVITGDEVEPSNPAMLVRDNVVRNNFIAHTGAAYDDTVGIFVGYTQGTVVEHNDLIDMPYSGISVGWGWGRQNSSTVGRNAVQFNRVSYSLRMLRDGGGVYTLGRQPDSVIRENYFVNQGREISGIYLDAGTEQFSITGNVVARSPFWGFLNRWNCPPYGPDHAAMRNRMTGNFSDGSLLFNDARDERGELRTRPYDETNTVADNTLVRGAWPAAAQAVINVSGLEPAFRGLHPDNVAPGSRATASTIFAPVLNPLLAADDDARTGWAPSAADRQPWWLLDMGSPRSVQQLEIVTRDDVDEPETRRNFVVEGSVDEAFTSPVVFGRVGPTALPFRAIWAARLEAPVSVRYVRVRKTVAEPFYLADVRVLGLRSESPVGE